MPDFDLDQFKKSWQQHDATPRYSQNDILKMLNKKSQNYVKYILWISILEFLVVIGLNVYYFAGAREEKDFMQILMRMGVKPDLQVLHYLDNVYLTIKLISIAIIVFFVIRFYKSYREIHVESDLKNLIHQIISFKKTVNYFILTNILYLVLATVWLMILLLMVVRNHNVVLDTATMAGIGVGLVVGLAFSIALVWLYYRVIYGIIIRKLSKNLEQLKAIEKEKEEI